MTNFPAEMWTALGGTIAGTLGTIVALRRLRSNELMRVIDELRADRDDLRDRVAKLEGERDRALRLAGEAGYWKARADDLARENAHLRDQLDDERPAA